MIDAREHLGLVIRIAQQIYPMDGTEADDVIGAGTVGLVQAALSFDESRGLAFSTFAGPRIRGAMRDHLRRRWGRSGRRRPREVSLGRASSLARTCSGHEDHVLERVDAERMLGRLEGRDRWVVEQYFVRGRSLAEIAGDLGVHISRVCQIKQAAIRGLRQGSVGP